MLHDIRDSFIFISSFSVDWFLKMGFGNKSLPFKPRTPPPFLIEVKTEAILRKTFHWLAYISIEYLLKKCREAGLNWGNPLLNSTFTACWGFSFPINRYNQEKCVGQTADVTDFF